MLFNLLSQIVVDILIELIDIPSIPCRYVHNTCDAEANLATYHSKKESNPDYEYSCPPCKQLVQNGRIVALRPSNSIEDDSLSASQDSFGMDDVSMDGSMTSTGKGKHASSMSGKCCSV